MGILLLLVLIAVSAYVWNAFFRSNTQILTKPEYVYVPTGSDYSGLMEQLKAANIVKDFPSFLSMANRMNLEKNIHPGRYEFSSGMSNYQMVKMLRSGQQSPVKLVINKLRTKQDIIRKISGALEADSMDLATLFNNNAYLKKYNIDSNQIQCAILPLTYEFYWNTPAKEVFEKIAASYEKFWNPERRDQAEKLKLSIPEVITIASIVEEETNKNDEKEKIASVYLNRIRKGMKLQADPTARFAYGDFGIKRVLNKHIRYPSPWNTYYTEGIPPGPICTPSAISIDAVLNAPRTDYLFFCAREDFSGYHNFASNGMEHEMNAQKFRRALDEKGIKK